MPRTGPATVLAATAATVATGLLAIDVTVSGLARGPRGSLDGVEALVGAAAWLWVALALRRGRDQARAGVIGLGALGLVQLAGALPLFPGLFDAAGLATVLNLGARLLAAVTAVVALLIVLLRGSGVGDGRGTDPRRSGRPLALFGAIAAGVATLWPTTTSEGDRLPLEPVIVDAFAPFVVVTSLSAVVPLALTVLALRSAPGAAAWLVGAPSLVLLASFVTPPLAFGAPTGPTVWAAVGAAGALALAVAARWWAILDRDVPRPAGPDGDAAPPDR